MAESTAVQVILDLNGWQALACLFKVLTYGSSFASAGGVFFLVWFSTQLSCTETQTIKRFILFMAGSAITFSVIRIAVINGMLSGDLSDMFNFAMTKMVLNSSEGTSTGLRLAGLIAIAISCRRRMSYFERKVTVCGAIIVSTSFAWVGHANEVIEKYGGSLFPEGLLIFHLIAVSMWLGSLWPLRILTYGDDLVRIAAIIHRFGQLITAAVAFLIIAGIGLLWMIVGQTDGLFFSAYGQMAAVKIIWVAVLLAIAMINKFWLTPLLMNENSNTIPQLRYSIIAEIAIAGIILLVTACFTTLVGPA